MFTARRHEDFIPIGVPDMPRSFSRDDMRYLPSAGWQKFETDRVLIEYLPSAIKAASDPLSQHALRFGGQRLDEFLEDFKNSVTV